MIEKRNRGSFQMESAKTVGSVKKEHGAIEVQESKPSLKLESDMLGKIPSMRKNNSKYRKQESKQENII